MKKFLIFLVLFGAVSIVQATPPTIPPDWQWFKVTAEFEPISIYDGVSITKDGVLKNIGSTPLYLFSKDYEGNKDGEGSSAFPELKTFPTNLVPYYKLVLGKVYIRLRDGYGRSTTSVYCTTSEINCAGVNIYDRVLAGMEVIPTKNITNINRPPNPEIPLPEEFRLLAYLGTNQIDIKGKFIYSLNDHFGKEYGKDTYPVQSGVAAYPLNILTLQVNQLVGIGIIIGLVLAFLLKKFWWNR